MFCRYCGKEIDEVSSFCVYCGKPTGRGAQKQEQQLTNDTHSNNAIAETVAPKSEFANASSAEKKSAAIFTASDKPIINKTADNKIPAKKPTTVNDFVNRVAPVPNEVGQAKLVAVPRKRNHIIIVVVAIIILIAIILLGACNNWFGLARVPVRGSLNEYSWNELSKISSTIAEATDEGQAIEIAKQYHILSSSGRIDETQTKSIILSDGSATEVQIAGVWHDERADGKGKTGLTFIFKNGMWNAAVNTSGSNNGGWEKSEIRSWLASDGINLLPKDLQDCIVSVKKKTNNIGKTDSISSVSITTDKLWLFSPVELFGPTDYYSGKEALCNTVLNAEGEKYKLFKECSTAMGKDNAVLIKRFNDECAWWTRSPMPTSSTAFCGVNQFGQNASAQVKDHFVVCPGFSI